MSVAISAIGAVTPLGKTWAETLAQYRQGKKRLLRDKSVIGPDGLPTRLAPVYAFHAQKDAPRRLAQLTLAALHDLLEQRPEAASAEILLSLPGWVRQGGREAAIIEWLAGELPFEPKSIGLCYSDEMTVPDLVLAAGHASRPRIVAAADTFLAPPLLDSLINSSRLLCRDQPHGLIPGEAATAFLIEPVREQSVPDGVLAVLGACHTGLEDMDLNCPSGILGQSLAGLVGRILDSGRSPRYLLSDLSGERWRSEEIALVLARHADRLPDHMSQNIETPASQLGYCGSAMAGILLAFGCDVASRTRAADGPVGEALILISQFGGLRSAAFLGGPERTTT